MQRSRVARAATLPALFTMAVACGSGGGDGDGRPPGGGRDHPVPVSVPIDRYAAELTATLCVVAERCQKPLFSGLRCPDFTLLVEEQLVSALRDAVSRGVTTYDPVKMAACLRDIETRHCDTRANEELCDAIAGTLPPNAPCTQHFECSGGFCEVTDACPGRCGAPPGLGEPCPTRGGNTCSAGLDCSSDGVCASMPGEGQACTSDIACQVGFLCVEGRCTAVTALPVVGEGEPCSVLSGPFCRAGLVCGEPSSTCVPVATSGGACTQALPDPCPVGEFCDVAAGASTGACRPTLAEGASCAGRQRCSAGRYCLDGRCSRLGSIGDPCDESSVPGARCYSDRCASGRCRWQDACSRVLE
jgi:hypothetical protein